MPPLAAPPDAAGGPPAHGKIISEGGAIFVFLVVLKILQKT